MLTKTPGGIPTLDDLRNHVQFAIGLELGTIPVYLSGLYTIQDGQNTAARRVIQSVVIEEMLHMALAANVLNAIGGVPSTAKIGDYSPVVNFPGTIHFLPGLGELNLQRFSVEALDTFMHIEQPTEGDEVVPDGQEDCYASIGEFYAAIEAKLMTVEDQVFVDGHASRGHCQIGPEEFYGASGVLFKVTNRDEAIEALQQIVRQGEGMPSDVNQAARDTGVAVPNLSVLDQDEQADGWLMYSHFARFKEIRHGRRYRSDQTIDQEPLGDVLPVDWNAVNPMIDNPRCHTYPEHPDIDAAMRSFNESYTALVDDLYRAFNGDPGEPTAPDEPGALQGPVTHMWSLKYQALELMKLPIPPSVDEDGKEIPAAGETVGAPFVYLR